MLRIRFAQDGAAHSLSLTSENALQVIEWADTLKRLRALVASREPKQAADKLPLMP